MPGNGFAMHSPAPIIPQACGKAVLGYTARMPKLTAKQQTTVSEVVETIAHDRFQASKRTPFSRNSLSIHCASSSLKAGGGGSRR
jgi:hypothetical protein